MSSYRVADLQAMASNRALSQQARAGCAAVAAAMQALSSAELVGYRVAFNVRADGASFCEIYPPTTPAPAPKQAPVPVAAKSNKLGAMLDKAGVPADGNMRGVTLKRTAPVTPVTPAPVVVAKKAAFVHTDATVHGRDGGNCVQIVSIVNPARAKLAFGKTVKVGAQFDFDSNARAQVLTRLGRAVTEPNLRSLSRILYGVVTYTSAVKRS
jgi:hypothetical protein